MNKSESQNSLSEKDQELIQKVLDIRNFRNNRAAELKKGARAYEEGMELTEDGGGDTFPGYNVLLQMVRNDLRDISEISDDQLAAAEQELMNQMSENGRIEIQAILGSAEMLKKIK